MKPRGPKPPKAMTLDEYWNSLDFEQTEYLEEIMNRAEAEGDPFYVITDALDLWALLPEPKGESS